VKKPLKPSAKDEGIKIPRKLEGKTEGQRRYLEALRSSDVTVCDGRAGTGKTYMAVGHAMQMVQEGKAERIIICRPAVEAGERLGFQPGDVQAKMGVYAEPIYEAIGQFCRSEEEYKAATDPKEGFVKLKPLAFMRGLNFRDAVCILDEAQNATSQQIRMFWNRACKGTKVIIAGSSLQCDLPYGPRDFLDVAYRLSNYQFREGKVSVVKLGLRDIVRSGLIAELEQCMEAEYEDDITDYESRVD